MSRKSQFEMGFSPLNILDEIRTAISGGAAKTAAALGNSSLSEALSNTRVEPVVLVENTLIHQEFTKNLLSANLDTFASWYLQMAARLLSSGVDAAKVTRALGQLSTNHNIDSAIQTIAVESQSKYALPSYNEVLELANSTNLLIEEVVDNIALESDAKRPTMKSEGASINKGMVAESAALSVGKEVTVRVGQINIPILIRLQTKAVSPALLKDIFEANAGTMDLAVRLRMYRMEEITTKQLITGSDLTERYERIAINDKNGDISAMMMDKANSLAYSVITNTIPLNRASGILVITKRTAADIERTVGGKLNDYRAREKYFKGTANTMISIVDEESAMVTTYYRGIKDRDVKPFSFFERRRESGTDLDPIIKALSSGSAPGRY